MLPPPRSCQSCGETAIDTPVAVSEDPLLALEHKMPAKAGLGDRLAAPRPDTGREIPMQDIPYGYCHCGCGQKTQIATKTNTAQYQRKGHPNRYLASHSAPKHPDYLEENRGYETPCWIWQGAHDWDGYGLVNRPAHRGNAHILYYKLHVAPVPRGLEIDHLCRVRDCVNPAHLQPKTHRENFLIGESPTAKN